MSGDGAQVTATVGVLLANGFVDLHLAEDGLTCDEVIERVLARGQVVERVHELDGRRQLGLGRPKLVSRDVRSTVTLDVTDGACADSGELLELSLSEVGSIASRAQFVLIGHRYS